MTKNEKTSPTNPTKDCEALVKNNSTCKDIEISALEFEGERIVYVEHEGMKLYPVQVVGEQYGYSSHDALQAFKANKGFLDGNHYRLKLRLYERAVFVPCLTGEGVLIYTSRLGIGKIPEDRQNKVIRTVQFMAKAAMGVLDGSLAPVESPPMIHRIKEKCNEGTLLTKQVGRLVKDKLMPEYARKGLNPRTAFSREHRAINVITNGEHESDLKHKLNSVGLDIQNSTKLSEVTLLEAGIIDDDTRWTISERVINNLYPKRQEEQIKLNEREMALIKRGCTETQKSLYEFRTTSQISGGSS